MTLQEQHLLISSFDKSNEKNVHHYFDLKNSMRVLKKISEIRNKNDEFVYSYRITPSKVSIVDNEEVFRISENEHGESMEKMIFIALVEFVQFYNDKPDITEGEEKTILNMLEGMCNIQEVLEPLGLKSKEISWCNDLYDECMVSIGESPDGDYQQRFFEKQEFYTYQQMFEAITIRISNMLQSMM